MKGKVYIVGAGPGDPELLTLKAARALSAADVVLHDDLVTPEILERVSPAASVFSVGKRCGRKSVAQEEINSLMVTYAQAGLTVVRLKGGDPSVFARSGEEIRTLRQARVDFEIIPGVTAATSAAAAAGISLTERHVSSSIVFLTGHHCASRSAEAAPGPRTALNVPRSSPGSPAMSAGASPENSTFVVYMPSDYSALAAELCAAGLKPETACLIISGASTGKEETYFTTLAELPQAAPLLPPKILIVGAVAQQGAQGKSISSEDSSLPVQANVR
jgi:uroporphyrin-III C-methyltransferase